MDKKYIAVPIVIAAGLGIWFAKHSKAEEIPPIPPPDEGKSNLTGYVKDSFTGYVISGAVVNINGLQTFTDISGFYSFVNIDPNIYSITFTKDGYNTINNEKEVEIGSNSLDIQMMPNLLNTGQVVINSIFPDGGLGLNAHVFDEVGLDNDGIPYAKLSVPISMPPVTITRIDYPDGEYELICDFIGLSFNITYIGPEYSGYERIAISAGLDFQRPDHSSLGWNFYAGVIPPETFPVWVTPFDAILYFQGGVMPVSGGQPLVSGNPYDLILHLMIRSATDTNNLDLGSFRIKNALLIT